MMFAPRYTVWHCGYLKKGKREMSNLDKVFERNRVTKLGIDAMITNYLRLERENATLREQLKDCSAAFDQQQEMLDRNAEQLASKQAKIDALMVEHCPYEMTKEQVEEWKKHQVVKEEEK